MYAMSFDLLTTTSSFFRLPYYAGLNVHWKLLAKQLAIKSLDAHGMMTIRNTALFLGIVSIT